MVLVLLVAGIILAAILTWVVPAGSFERHDDPVTGKTVVTAGTYHRVPQKPVGPFEAVVGLPPLPPTTKAVGVYFPHAGPINSVTVE